MDQQPINFLTVSRRDVFRPGFSEAGRIYRKQMLLLLHTVHTHTIMFLFFGFAVCLLVVSCHGNKATWGAGSHLRLNRDIPRRKNQTPEVSQLTFVRPSLNYSKNDRNSLQ